MPRDLPDRPTVARVLTDLAVSPTPYHAVARAADRLAAAGFAEVSPDTSLDDWPEPGHGAYLKRAGALVAWWVPESVQATTGFVAVGAHTDSPNLRLRANAEQESAGWDQLGVEVYGGALTNSWLDRDLSLAGRVIVASDDPSGRAILVADTDPVLRIPQLAIHLDREIREKGLLLDPQLHLTPLWALSATEGPTLAEYLGRLARVDPSQIVAWELMAYDTQPAAIVGRDRDLFATARIDNQLSCFAGIEAITQVAGAGATTTRTATDQRISVLALYDHEEVGSTSATGADGAFLGSILERISGRLGGDRDDYLRRLSRSIVVSADGAHATHPNYAERHEPQHHIAVNQGVVVKRNVNQRYATDAASEGWFRSVCAQAGVPVQTYIHRNDLPCGSTIGPATAATLGVSTVDIGAPQLAMHSAREMAGVDDIEHLTNALRGCFAA